MKCRFDRITLDTMQSDWDFVCEMRKQSSQLASIEMSIQFHIVSATIQTIAATAAACSFVLEWCTIFKCSMAWHIIRLRLLRIVQCEKP